MEKELKTYIETQEILFTDFNKALKSLSKLLDAIHDTQVKILSNQDTLHRLIK